MAKEYVIFFLKYQRKDKMQKYLQILYCIVSVSRLIPPTLVNLAKQLQVIIILNFSRFVNEGVGSLLNLLKSFWQSATAKT
jgi:hypothetical protein